MRHQKGVFVNKTHFPALCFMQRGGSDNLMHDNKSQRCLCEGTMRRRHTSRPAVAPYGMPRLLSDGFNQGAPEPPQDLRTCRWCSQSLKPCWISWRQHLPLQPDHPPVKGLQTKATNRSQVDALVASAAPDSGNISQIAARISRAGCVADLSQSALSHFSPATAGAQVR